MNDREKRYWFGAKRYGYGWGLPISWEGWVVLMLWLAIFILVRRYLIPRETYAHMAFAVTMVGLLLSICYAKGAPARWRFGDHD